AVTAAIDCAHATDAFDAVQCGTDFSTALVGKRIDNGPVAVAEKKHAKIGLKHEGSEDVSDTLIYEAWTICGNSYHLLVRDDVIRAALRADHSRSAPAFVGTCQANGSPTSYPVFAILKAPESGAAGNASSADNTLMPAQSAWRIDESNGQFVAMDASHLKCARDGISTADGGR
ncbi:MAG TPA: hypothetical protein VH375_06425, partial [Rhodanobacteraceae bacterium]